MTYSLTFHPAVIAHRGASGYAPENTLISFIKAVQLGVKWIEFDVTQAACDEPIIFHDATLERTTDGQGEVIHYPYQYLRTLDAGSWFDSRFAGERIPSLRQVLAFLGETHTSANIEIKSFPGREKQLITRVLQEVQPYLNDARFTLLFSSFSMDALKYIRQSAPNALLGLLLHEWQPGWQEMCATLACVSVHVDQAVITRETAHQVKELDKILLCYTVNQRARAQELFSWGVDAVFSDVPDKILKSS